MYWTHACFAGARSGWRKKGMFELMTKYCQASIMYACVETNSRLLSFSFNVQVIYEVHMSHYLKEPRRHLPKKKSIIDTQPHSQPQLQQNGSLHWALTFCPEYIIVSGWERQMAVCLFLRLASSHVSWRWGFCWSAATCLLLGCLLLYMSKGVLAPPQPLFLWSRTTFVERSTTIDTFLILSTRIICLN